MDRALVEIVTSAILANHACESTCKLHDGRVIPVAPEGDSVRALACEIAEAIIFSRGSGPPLGETMTAHEVMVRIRRLGVPVHIHGESAPQMKNRPVSS